MTRPAPGRSLRRVMVGSLVLAGTILVLGAPPAAAGEPERSGWWNRLSGPGIALPQPTTADSDLRVASGGTSPTAYAALLYTQAGATSATLDVPVRADSAVGTVAVVACPTATGDWTAGPNQPYDAAPVFDCTVGQAFGVLSADGATLSFLLDASLQSVPGTWSVALVPQPDATVPFAVDLAVPGPEAFVPQVPREDDPEASVPVDPASDSGAGSGASDPGTSEVPFLALDGLSALPPSFDTSGGALTGADIPMPDVAPETTLPGSAASAGVAPQIALPAAARTPVSDLGGGESRVAALLVLVVGAVAVGYVSGQQSPALRLLGGRARVVAAVGGLPVEALPEGRLPVEGRPRGHGRFAKQRDAPPRRLR